MAKQDFLQGGFKGKLGATVGYGWKNKMCIKAYQKPTDRKTQKQLTQREKFAFYVLMAQLSREANYKTNIFNSDDSTSWANRVKTAKLLKDSGATELNLIPLVPYGKETSYKITSLIQTELEDRTTTTFNVQGTLPLTDRDLSVIINEYNKETNQLVSENKIYAATYNAEAQTVVIRNVTFNQRYNYYKCRVISYGENSLTLEDTISSQMIDLEVLQYDYYTEPYMFNYDSVASKTEYAVKTSAVINPSTWINKMRVTISKNKDGTYYRSADYTASSNLTYIGPTTRFSQWSGAGQRIDGNKIYVYVNSAKFTDSSGATKSIKGCTFSLGGEEELTLKVTKEYDAQNIDYKVIEGIPEGVIKVYPVATIYPQWKQKNLETGEITNMNSMAQLCFYQYMDKNEFRVWRQNNLPAPLDANCEYYIDNFVQDVLLYPQMEYRRLRMICTN